MTQKGIKKIKITIVQYNQTSMYHISENKQYTEFDMEFVSCSCRGIVFIESCQHSSRGFQNTTKRGIRYIEVRFTEILLYFYYFHPRTKVENQLTWTIRRTWWGTGCSALWQRPRVYRIIRDSRGEREWERETVIFQIGGSTAPDPEAGCEVVTVPANSPYPPQPLLSTLQPSTAPTITTLAQQLTKKKSSCTHELRSKWIYKLFIIWLFTI